MTSVPRNEKNRQSASSWLIFWIFLSFILGIVGLAAAIFNHYQDAQLSTQLETMVTVPQSSVVEIQQVLTDNQAQLVTQQSQIALLQKNLTSVQNTVNRYTPINVQWLNQNSAALHQQINQLQTVLVVMHLQLVQQLLLTQQDKATVLTELSHAVNILELMGNNPQATQAVSKVAQQVAQLPTINANGVLNGLQQLDTQLTTLTFQSTQLPVAQPDAQASWLQRLINHIKSLVVIHDNNALSQQLLTQTDRLNAVRTLKLWLQAASSSAWQHNQMQYQWAMDQLITTTLQFTDMTPAQVAWLEKAHQISTQAVGYSTNSISPCVNALQTVINRLQPSKPAGAQLT